MGLHSSSSALVSLFGMVVQSLLSIGDISHLFVPTELRLFIEHILATKNVTVEEVKKL
jgi:hypothetical protein